MNKSGMCPNYTFILSVDITPLTSAGRVVMMLLIIITVAVLPVIITDFLDTLNQQSGMSTCITSIMGAYYK